MIKGNLLLLAFFLLCVHGWPSFLNAEEVEVDSILDQLEKRLDEQEGTILRQEEKSALKDLKDAKVKEYKFKTETIKASTPEEKELEKLSNAIMALENQVNRFELDVHMLRQEALENANLNNFVEIQGEFDDPQQTRVRDLVVTIDGVVVLSLNEKTDLWLNQKQMSFYAGPLTPGTHEVQVDAKLVRLASADSLSPHNKFDYVNKKQVIKIPDGKFEKKVFIKMSPDSNGKDQRTDKHKSSEDNTTGESEKKNAKNTSSDHHVGHE